MNLKENVKNTDIWIRGLFILIYAVIFYFVFFLIWFVVIFQFIIKLITSELNIQLLNFSDSLIQYISQILRYISFKSEEKPFPFSPLPNKGNNRQRTTQKKYIAKNTEKKATAQRESTDKTK